MGFTFWVCCVYRSRYRSVSQNVNKVGVPLSVKERNTEPLESETLVNVKRISFCWRTLRARLVRVEGDTDPAWGAQWDALACPL